MKTRSTSGTDDDFVDGFDFLFFIVDASSAAVAAADDVVDDDDDDEDAGEASPSAVDSPVLVFGLSWSASIARSSSRTALLVLS